MSLWARAAPISIMHAQSASAVLPMSRASGSAHGRVVQLCWQMMNLAIASVRDLIDLMEHTPNFMGGRGSHSWCFMAPAVPMPSGWVLRWLVQTQCPMAGCCHADYKLIMEMRDSQAQLTRMN